LGLIASFQPCPSLPPRHTLPSPEGLRIAGQALPLPPLRRREQPRLGGLSARKVGCVIYLTEIRTAALPPNFSRLRQGTGV